MSPKLDPHPPQALAEAQAELAPPAAREPTAGEGLLDYVEAPNPDPEVRRSTAPQPPTAVVGLRSARLTGFEKGAAQVQLRGASAPVRADVAPEVEPALLQRALQEQQQVLVDVEPGCDPVIVGLLQTRVAEPSRLSGSKIEVEATEQLTLRSGRAALRLKSDGDIEVVGNRISAASRGLFKIVGRVLRLN